MEYDAFMTMSTEPLFVPALASLDDLVPHDGLLSPAELEEIARGLAARTELWEPLVHSDPERRRYELVYEDERMDAWILSWMPDQGTGFPAHSRLDAVRYRYTSKDEKDLPFTINVFNSKKQN